MALSCFVQFAGASLHAQQAPKGLAVSKRAGVVATPKRRDVISMVLSFDERERMVRSKEDASFFERNAKVFLPPLVACAIAAAVQFGIPPAQTGETVAPPAKIIQASSTLSRTPEHVMSPEISSRIEEQTRIAAALEKEIGALEVKTHDLKSAYEASNEKLALTKKKMAVAKDDLASSRRQVVEEQKAAENQFMWREAMNARTALSIALVATFSVTWVTLTRL